MDNSSYVAEGLGSFIFVMALLAAGSKANGLGDASMPLLVGAGLALGMYASRALSKKAQGDINPLSTVVNYASGELEMKPALGLVVAQVVGGVLAYYLFKYVSNMSA